MLPLQARRLLAGARKKESRLRDSRAERGRLSDIIPRA